MPDPGFDLTELVEKGPSVLEIRRIDPMEKGGKSASEFIGKLEDAVRRHEDATG